VIGTALAHKANGPGFRSIAERMGRPESTVRRWLRRTTGEHLQWLHRRGTERLVLVAREAFGTIRFVGNPLGDALCVLSAAAVEDRRRFGFPDPPWDLIGIYTLRTSAVPTPQRRTEPSRPVLPCPDASVIVPIVGVHNDAQQSPCRRGRHDADDRPHSRLQDR
jgi:hypothetical protein